MDEYETAQVIDAAAAAWAIKLDAANDDASSPEVEAWLAGDHRRGGALLRAQAALSFLDRGRALAVPKRAAEGQAFPFAGLGRRRALLGGAVAGLAAVVSGVALSVSRSTRYETLLGEVRQVPLGDGSIATINTASTVEVTLTRQIRQINLLRGEAWFGVAKDASRPFVVSAGTARVRAVGTAFSVWRHDAGTDVLVIEGTVDAWIEGVENSKFRLGAGKRAFVSNGAPPRVVTLRADEIERRLAWRTGQISLGGETLAYAAVAFNRYNDKKIVIADGRLADETLVGQFSANQPEAFAHAVAGMLDATVIDDGATIRLSLSASQ